MLVLSRKAGESIKLVTSQGAIHLTITGIHGNKARVGIVAPPSVRITRDDIKKTEPRPNDRAEPV